MLDPLIKKIVITSALPSVFNLCFLMLRPRDKPFALCLVPSKMSAGKKSKTVSFGIGL